MIKEAVLGTSSYERAVFYLEREVATASLVVPEGPPIYLWPDQKISAQRWDNQGFEVGWSMVNRFATKFPTRVHQFFLVDELNNRPSDITEAQIDIALHDLANASPALSRSPLLVKNCHPGEVRRYKESVFLTATGVNRCSNLDAAFQRQKLLFFEEHYPEFGFEDFQSTNQIFIRLSLA